MTGPEHYAEAERLLALAGSGADPRDPLIVATAQVHATLALAAATLDVAPYADGAVKIPHAWAGALA